LALGVDDLLNKGGVLTPEMARDFFRRGVHLNYALYRDGQYFIPSREMQKAVLNTRNPGEYLLGGLAGDVVLGVAADAAAATVVKAVGKGEKAAELVDDVMDVEKGMDEAENVVKSGGEAAQAGKKAPLVTEIKYKPSSGIVLKPNPEKTTTILGSYEKDIQYIVEETGNIKNRDFGPQKGGFNILNVPDEPGLSRKEFWDKHNHEWLDEAIARGDDIVLATKPEGDVLSYYDPKQKKDILTGFGMEYDYLTRVKKYVYDEKTGMMIKK
jgi:hypothetical protein